MITIEVLQDFVLAVVSLNAALDVQHPHRNVVLITLINLFLFEESTSTVFVNEGPPASVAEPWNCCVDVRKDSLQFHGSHPSDRHSQEKAQGMAFQGSRHGNSTWQNQRGCWERLQPSQHVCCYHSYRTGSWAHRLPWNGLKILFPLEVAEEDSDNRNNPVGPRRSHRLPEGPLFQQEHFMCWCSLWGWLWVRSLSLNTPF